MRGVIIFPLRGGEKFTPTEYPALLFHDSFTEETGQNETVPEGAHQVVLAESGWGFASSPGVQYREAICSLGPVYAEPGDQQH